MEIIYQLLSFAVSLFSFVLILRMWFQFCNVNYNLPATQTLIKLTAPMVNFFKFLPVVKGINLAVFACAFLILFLEKTLIFHLPIQYAVLISFLSIVKKLGFIIFYVTFIRALMSWVTQGQSALDYLVVQITEPLLGFIRRILPNTGMIDFSVMALGLILIFLNKLMYQIFTIFWLWA